MMLGKMLIGNKEDKISLIKYGRLYNFPAVWTNQLAPTGYNVPSYWGGGNNLYSHIGSVHNVSPNNFGVTNHLKHRRQVWSPLGAPWAVSSNPMWSSNANYGRDTVLFGALPGGWRTSAGTFGYINSRFLHWFREDAGNGQARGYQISYDTDTPSYFLQAYSMGFSVKCSRLGTTAEQSLDDGTLLEKVEDIDGNVYDTVKIGSYVYFVQNLATTKLRNGTPINLISSGAGSTTVPEYYNYGNNEANTFFADKSSSIWIPDLMIKPVL